jgi:hypothetical protein
LRGQPAFLQTNEKDYEKEKTSIGATLLLPGRG